MLKNLDKDIKKFTIIQVVVTLIFIVTMVLHFNGLIPSVLMIELALICITQTIAYGMYLTFSLLFT